MRRFGVEDSRRKNYAFGGEKGKSGRTIDNNKLK
jgi:hypothetical protein